jgi:hypothetical protein
MWAALAWMMPDSGSAGQAGDRTRTGFLQLGRLMCNQLHLARAQTSDYRFGRILEPRGVWPGYRFRIPKSVVYVPPSLCLPPG